jgi:hypothetical protein
VSAKPALHIKASREIEDAAKVYFQQVGDTIREAARIAAGRDLTPERIREVCSYGWTQMFSYDADQS